jgi:hypothetical protein
VEETVYSKLGGGTVEDEDRDLHFTLTLDPQYTKCSNKYDCSPTDPDYKQCQSHPDKIVVEVICHKEQVLILSYCCNSYSICYSMLDKFSAISTRSRQ